MKTTSRLIALLALSCLAACDSRTASEFKQERASRQYQVAMDDYTAGRLDAAVKGFEKVLRADPSNTSARFQLACLLQDSRHDNLGAFCNYREYLQQAPDSDKAKMAKERLAICERALAEELAKKMNLIGDSAIAEEIEHSRSELAAMKKKNDELLAKLKDSAGAVSELKGENERLRKLLASLAGESGGTPEKADIVSSVKDLLDDEPAAPTVAALDEAKSLNALAEADDGDVGTASSLLPTQAADAKEKKKASEDAAKKAKAEREAKKDAIPDTYVVQEGDTLYKIALRFYGRTSAWKMIREANKETITTDGRVRTGQTLKLPK
ncbi:MAG: LysM peptidoglycan-binding domain-containing protein [Kiritimatiellae bacterium]|nr:LysM peptidoglycan-binding domain-containing protein [Kiritimatiellia bacterium]